MNRIDEFFNNTDKNTAIIAGIVAGKKGLDYTKDEIKAAISSGADIIEIGVPFSDPCADSLVVQSAHMEALENGINIFNVLDMIKEIRSQISVPFVLHTYYNVMVQYGVDEFFKNCELCGVDALVIPDLPYEENGDIDTYAKQYGVYKINHLAPTCDARLEEIAKNSCGFIYCVTTPGDVVTKDRISNFYADFIKKAEQYASCPVIAGFDVCDKAVADELSKNCAGYNISSILADTENIKDFSDKIQGVSAK